MTPAVAQALPRASYSRCSVVVHSVLANCLDIRSIWSIGHETAGERSDASPLRLLAFGSHAVLERLRKCDRLHTPEVEFLVVVDGDLFATAWGPAAWSGSLARWAWRETSTEEAYYDESRWAHAGSVVRVRRKACLVWRQA